MFLGRSAERNVWALNRDVDPATAAELEAMLRAEPRCIGDGFGQGPSCRARVLELRSPIAVEYRGPAYVLSGAAAAAEA